MDKFKNQLIEYSSPSYQVQGDGSPRAFKSRYMLDKTTGLKCFVIQVTKGDRINLYRPYGEVIKDCKYPLGHYIINGQSYAYVTSSLDSFDELPQEKQDNG